MPQAARLRRLAALTMVLTLGALGLYGWRLRVSHSRLQEAALSQLSTRAAELAGAIAEQTEATLRTADFALRQLRDEYQDRQLNLADLQSILNGFPPGAIIQLSVIDARGHLEWSSLGTDASRGVYLGDREHFRVHRDGSGDTLFIGPPVLGRASGQWSIQLSRPLRRKGAFGGVMVLSLSPRYLADTHRQMVRGGHNIISLFRPDGAYLTRMPRLEEALGKSLPGDRPFLKKDAAPEGLFRATAAFDHIDRTYAWQRGRNYPVTINVGLDEALVLGPIEHEIARSRLRALGGGGLVLLLATLVSVLLLRTARQQQALAASEALHRSLFLTLAEGVLVTDANVSIIAVNPAFSVLTGYSAAEVVGKKPSLLASGVHDEAFYAAMWQGLARDGHWEGEISNRHQDGRLYIAWLRISVVPERPGHGRRYVALFSDITARKREDDAIWRQANFDPLTGLANRQLLADRLARLIPQAQRQHSSVAVLFIDLDRFKSVNDQHGHATGDELLREVAGRLQSCLRAEDTVARLGGDEFVAVLPGLREDSEVPGTIADKILAVLAAPYSIGTLQIGIGCSIGISLYPQHAASAAALLARADRAMYAAKEAGRHTWRGA